MGKRDIYQSHDGSPVVMPPRCQIFFLPLFPTSASIRRRLAFPLLTCTLELTHSGIIDRTAVVYSSPVQRHPASCFASDFPSKFFFPFFFFLLLLLFQTSFPRPPLGDKHVRPTPSSRAARWPLFLFEADTRRVTHYDRQRQTGLDVFTV